jgi:hypothetical protein
VRRTRRNRHKKRITGLKPMCYSFMELVKSALRKVEPDFFKVKTTYNTEGIVRERVFCYELYHQMRLLMENNVECKDC